MKEKNEKIKSKNLIIKSLSNADLEKRADSGDKKYSAALELCKKNPEERLAHTVWEIFLKSDCEKTVGEIFFDTENMLPGSAEIKINLQEESKIYMEEVLKKTLYTALTFGVYYFIYISVPEQTDGILKILKDHAFFDNDDNGKFVHEQTPTKWSVIFMLLGISMSVPFSVGSSKGFIFMPLFMMVWFLIGLGLEKSDKAKREKILGIKSADDKTDE